MLNKKRLAALGLSAVMVASTASLPVSAADFSDGTTVAAEAQEDADAFAVEGNEDADVSVAAEGEAKVIIKPETADLVKNTVKYTVDGVEQETGIELVETLVAPTCQTTGKAVYRTTKVLPGEKEKSEFTVTLDKLTGHEDGYIEKLILVQAGTCDPDNPSPNVYRKYKYCPTCKITIGDPIGEPVNIPVEHSFTTSKTTYELITTTTAGKNMEFPNGDRAKKPVVIDPTKTGEYYEITSGHCSKCEKDVTEKKKVTVEATESKEVSRLITAVKGISKDEKTVAVGNDITGRNIDVNDILLADCDVAGSYTVEITYSDQDKKTIEVPVPAHHVADKAVVEAVKDADKKLIKAVYDKEGKLVDVINETCDRDIEYTVTVRCKANPQHIISKETKVAPKSTNHTVDTTSAAGRAYTKAKAGNTLTNVDIEALEASKNFKVTLEGSDCEAKDATVKIEAYCQICGDLADTLTGVKTIGLKHVLTRVIENRVEATCEKTGSYDLVTKCKRCGKVIETKKITIPILAHTNKDAEDTDKVDLFLKVAGNRLVTNGTVKVGQVINANSAREGVNYTYGAEKGGKVAVGIYTECTICHKNVVALKDPVDDNLVATVTSVTAPTYDRTGTELLKAGTVGLKITYTRKDNTVVTAETNVAYIDKTGVKIPDELKSGLELDLDGEYRYYVNGKFDSTFRGIVDYDGKQFLVNNGMLAKTAQGLHAVGDKFYFLANGQVQTQHTGLAMYDGESFYVVNGVMDVNKNGIVDYNGGKFAFAAGRLATEANGVWQDPSTGKWYFLANGQVQTQHSGVALYDGEFFYIQKGELAKDYKGTITYNGAKFNVVEGQLYGPIK